VWGGVRRTNRKTPLSAVRAARLLPRSRRPVSEGLMPTESIFDKSNRASVYPGAAAVEELTLKPLKIPKRP
jgi:hypothetical protein